MTEVADDLFFVRGMSSNWVIIGGSDTATLIDTGYPGDAELLDASVEAAGFKTCDVSSILVTHAHADHIGSAERYRREFGTRILALDTEVGHLKREFLEQVSPKTALPHLIKPRFARWMHMAVRKGHGLDDVTVAQAAAVPAEQPLPFPGAPIAIPTPGHTRGHAAYWFAEARILVSGDALITGHETSKRTGPQMLHTVFHHDEPGALRSLARFAGLDARLVLPGHGDVWSGDLTVAVNRMSEGVAA
ncbi:MBL fold metallo-hydrolase [Frondihabitans cladoniiphilus]|uniref:MBL fold metallo-hydrolase n=1 Tax=Frondihabitans cladoniiphilus TaxID=715785 RepID=A0ABP8VY98_9MICO